MSDHRREISLEPIGIIHTPYAENVPSQPDKGTRGEFRIEIFDKYEDSLELLDTFSHVIVIFYLHRIEGYRPKAHPPMAKGLEVGTFASRSPHRPNPIGLSSVELISMDGNKLYISPIDAIDGTPVIDIKPYIRRLDCIQQANNGWSDDI